MNIHVNRLPSPSPSLAGCRIAGMPDDSRFMLHDLMHLWFGGWRVVDWWIGR